MFIGRFSSAGTSLYLPQSCKYPKAFQSRPSPFAAQWTIAHQALLSMGLSRQKYWSKLPFPTPKNIHPGTNAASLKSPALAGRLFYHQSHLGIPSIQFSSVTQSRPTLRSHGLQQARPRCPSPTPGVYSNTHPLSQ